MYVARKSIFIWKGKFESASSFGFDVTSILLYDLRKKLWDLGNFGKKASREEVDGVADRELELKLYISLPKNIWK